MGGRHRNIGKSLSTKEDMEASLFSEQTSETLMAKAEYVPSSGESGHDDDIEEEIITVDADITTSTIEDITGGALWYELERELEREDDEARIQAKEEEVAAVAEREIIEEENALADAVESKIPVSALDVADSHRFYPPGKIMHIVSVPSSDTANSGHGGTCDERVAIYETPRNLYTKIRLTRTMISDHYMPMYKKMIELLIMQLENDETCSTAS